MYNPQQGDRVYVYDTDKTGQVRKYYGTLMKNTDYPEVSEWYIKFDDGNDCAVLDMDSVVKV